jgi:hypothetical protein
VNVYEITDRSVNGYDINLIRTIHRSVYEITNRSVNGSDMQKSINFIRTIHRPVCDFIDQSMNGSDEIYRFFAYQNHSQTGQ